jgi:Protein of unknown function (DUF3617)
MSVRRVLIAVALTGLLSFPAWADMKPGMYQISAASAGAQPQSQAQCMSPEDAKDPITPLLTGGDPGCTFSNKAASATHFTSDFACNSQGQQFSGHADFAMTPDSFQGTVTAQVTSPQGPQTVTTTMSGKRTGDCQ